MTGNGFCRNSFSKSSFNANYKDDKIPFNVKDAIEVFIENKKKGGGVSDNWKKKYTNLKNKITLFDVYKKRQKLRKRNGGKESCLYIRVFKNGFKSYNCQLSQSKTIER